MHVASWTKRIGCGAALARLLTNSSCSPNSTSNQLVFASGQVETRTQNSFPNLFWRHGASRLNRHYRGACIRDTNCFRLGSDHDVGINGALAPDYYFASQAAPQSSQVPKHWKSQLKWSVAPRALKFATMRTGVQSWSHNDTTLQPRRLETTHEPSKFCPSQNFHLLQRTLM